MTDNTSVLDRDKSLPADSPGSPTGRRSLSTVVVAVLLLVSLVAATWFTVVWAMAFFSDSETDVRAELLSDAGQAAISLNTFDTNNIAGTFAQIEASITGEELRAEMQDARASLESQPPTGGMMTAVVADSAISALDLDADTASVVAVVIRTTTGTTGETLDERVMMQMHLRDVEGSWKVETVDSFGLAQTIASSMLDGTTAEAPSTVPTEPAPAPEPGAQDPAPATGN